MFLSYLRRILDQSHRSPYEYSFISDLFKYYYFNFHSFINLSVMSIQQLDKGPLNALVLTRIFIGWHFLYEGIYKLYIPGWTAKGYLLSSEGFLSPLFQWMASDGLIGIIDFVNLAGLVIVGLTLLLGYLEKIGSLIGVILLVMYYLSHPPFPGLEQIGTEGNYMFVNKNLIEAAALLILFHLPTGDYFGIKRLTGSK